MDIVVIGNGFDIKCGLDSRFSDFYTFRKAEQHEFYKNLEKYLFTAQGYLSKGVLKLRFIPENIGNVLSTLNSDISIWELILTIKTFGNKDESLWKDIEAIIFDFINQNSHSRVMDFNRLLGDLSNPNLDLNEIPNGITQQDAFQSYTLFALVINLMSLFPNSADQPQIKNILLSRMDPNLKSFEFGYYLIRELNRFEKSFCKYLHKQKLEKQSYEYNALLLLNRLVCSDSKKEDIHKVYDKIYLLSFNYTKPYAKITNNNGSNVHGFIGVNPDASDCDVIIGVDQEQIRDSNNCGFMFTKTYRKLFLDQRANSDPLPQKSKVERIVFYGHSLSQADYSYFRSIFDFYDIETSNITLIFCFSVYNKSLRHEITNNHYKNVYSLVLSYSGQANKASGKNLVHKLLLEKRLRIVEIE